MVAFLAGLWLSLSLPVERATPLLPVLAIGSVLVCAGGRWPRLAGWLGVGVVWGMGAMAFMQQARPAPALHGETVVATGQVAGLVSREPGRQRFRFVPGRLDPYPDERPLPRAIRVSWYDAGRRVQAGERWSLELRLKRPRGFMNPVAFDYERYLAGGRLDARATVVGGETARRLASGWGTPAIRAAVVERLHEHAPPGDGRALLTALAVGDRRAFDDGLWQTLRTTGTAHLVAISGLHVGLIALIGWAGGRWLIARVPALNRRVPAPVGAAVPALALAAGYALLAGWSLPTVRALAMAAVGIVCLWWRRRPSLPRIVLVTLLGLSVLAPWSLLRPGFWLSFGAVLLLIAAAALVPRGTGRVAVAVRLQLVLSVGVGALTLVFFREAAWLALPVNLVAIPLFAFALVPASLLAAGMAAVWPGTALAGTAVTGVTRALGVTADALRLVGEYGGTLTPPAPAAVALALGLMLAGGLLRGLVPLGVPAAAAAALVAAGALDGGAPHFELTVLEVGQGTAVVTRAGDHTLVYDTGPAWGSTAAARFTLLPFLRQHGYRPVDRLIVSHADRDHAGGVDALMKAATVREIRAGEPLDRPSRRCRAGQRWRRNDVRFRVIWPPPGDDRSGNAASCVLLIEVAGRRLLLAGDIGITEEPRVLARLTEPVDVLLVPHHGSEDASGREFVRTVAPRHAIISAGFDNSYGLPAPAVVARYRCAGATVLETARVGAVTVTVAPDGRLDVRARRADERRFYHEGLRGASFRPAPENRYDPPPTTTPTCDEEAP